MFTRGARRCVVPAAPGPRWWDGRMRLGPALLALALLVGACGGGDARESRAQARESAAAQQDGIEDGATFVPEALRAFRCEADDDGAWFAVGTVKNTTKAPVSYRVTVQVGKGGDDVAASELDLPALAAGRSTEFTLDELPGAGSEGPCRVQLLAVPPES